MKELDAILMCYGKYNLEQNFEIKIRGIFYNAWYIYGLDTKEQLLQWLNEEQIIDFYESGI